MINETYVSDFIKILESGLELEPLSKCSKCGYVFVPEAADAMGNFVACDERCPKCNSLGVRYEKGKS